MKKHDLVAPCGDYCGGCGQYNRLIIETAKQMKELSNLYGFELGLRVHSILSNS